jgi:hypothetical protein
VIEQTSLRFMGVVDLAAVAAIEMSELEWPKAWGIPPNDARRKGAGPLSPQEIGRFIPHAAPGVISEACVRDKHKQCIPIETMEHLEHAQLRRETQVQTPSPAPVAAKQACKDGVCPWHGTCPRACAEVLLFNIRYCCNGMVRTHRPVLKYCFPMQSTVFRY